MPDQPEQPDQSPASVLPTGGTVRPVTRWGTEVMHRPQARVTSYDEELRSLVADMVATMYAADGVGLAACQIGVDLAVFCFDCPDASGRRTVGVVANPVVTLPEGEDRQLDDGDEGCLSYPGAFVECARPDFAACDGLGLDGEPVHFEGDGLLARCLQHETDHTQGRVFGDRLRRNSCTKLCFGHNDVDSWKRGVGLAGPVEIVPFISDLRQRELALFLGRIDDCFRPPAEGFAPPRRDAICKLRGLGILFQSGHRTGIHWGHEHCLRLFCGDNDRSDEGITFPEFSKALVERLGDFDIFRRK